MNKEKLKTLKAIRKQDSKIIADPCYVAESTKDRVLGLMGETELKQGSALWISPCNSIHTFFMKIKIDAVYLDKKLKIVAIQKAIKPWRIAMPVFKAHSVLEMPNGASEVLKEGDELWLS